MTCLLYLHFISSSYFIIILNSLIYLLLLENHLVVQSRGFIRAISHISSKAKKRTICITPTNKCV